MIQDETDEGGHPAPYEDITPYRFTGNTRVDQANGVVFKNLAKKAGVRVRHYDGALVAVGTYGQIARFDKAWSEANDNGALFIEQKFDFDTLGESEFLDKDVLKALFAMYPKVDVRWSTPTSFSCYGTVRDIEDVVFGLSTLASLQNYQPALAEEI
jgi:hypothetical protein